MCFRYKYTQGSLGDYVDDVIASKAVKVQSDGFNDRIDIFPGEPGEILIVENGERVVVPSVYGLIPPFIPQGRIQPSRLHNCRDDSLTKTPRKISFDEPFRLRRCITSIRQIEENLGQNKWMEVRSARGKDFQIASIFNYPHHLSPTITHALITTDPNSVIAPHFDRMPVMLDEEGLEIWLNPDTPIPDLLALLKPAPEPWIGELGFRQEPRRKKSDDQDNLFED